MKQKKIGDILYVFDDVPYYIQEDTDATTIYVQEEYLSGYQELNPALAFTPYNYHLLRVSKPEWADYINADDEPAEDKGYSPDAMDLNGRMFMMSSFANGDIGIAIGIEEGASSSHSLSVDRSELEEQMQGIGASDDNEDDDLVGEYDSDYDPTEVRSEKSVPLVSKIIVTKQGYGQYTFNVALSESEILQLLSIDYSDTESETATISIDEQTNTSVLVFGLMNKQEIVPEPEKEAAGISFVSDSASIDLKDDRSTTFELSNPNNLTGLTAYASDPSCTVEINNNIVYVTPSTTGTYTVYVEFAGDDNYLPSIISATLTVADTSEPPVDTRVSPELIFDHNDYNFDIYTDGSTGTISIINPHDVQNVSVTSDNPISMNVTEGAQEIEVTVTLAQGTFNITASFAGDANYLPQTIYTTMTVSDSTPAVDPMEGYDLLAETDWSKESQYTGYASANAPNMTLNGNGLEFEIQDVSGVNYWEPELDILCQSASISQGKDVKVRLVIDYTPYTSAYSHDGEIHLNLKDFSAGDNNEATFYLQSGENTYIVDITDIQANESSSVLLYQCGHAPGMHIIKTVEVYVEEDSTPADTRVSPELQFDQPSYSFDIYTDGSTGTFNIHNPYDVQNVSVTSDMPLSISTTENPLEIEVSLTLAQGTFNITASFAGDANYLPQTIYTTVTVSDSTPAQQDQSYGCSLSSSDIGFDPDVSDQDIEDAITNNLVGYDAQWMPEPTISVKFGGGDSDYVCQDISMSQLDFSSNMSSITFGSTVWTVYYTIAANDYVGEHYPEQNLEFTITFEDYPPSYGVSLRNSHLDFDDPNTTSQDITDEIENNLDGYDAQWMPEPTITVMFGSGDSDVVCSDVQMSQLDFSSNMSSITFGSTVWTVYYTIAANDYVGEHYAEQNLQFTMSFILPHDDYQVSVTSDTIQVEYDAGSSNHASEVKNAIMANISGYDDTWMPSLICNIWATDPNTGDEVTITENYDINSLDWIQDLQTAFDESGVVVPDQTEWRIFLSIAQSTYNDVVYNDWYSGDITLEFISPVVSFPNYFRLTSNQNGSTVQMQKGSSAPNITFDYTTDEGATWSQWDLSSITLDNGESVCFRCISNGTNTGDTINGYVPNYGHRFKLTGDISASGNIMSLLYGDDFEDKTALKGTSGTFGYLFYHCTVLTDVSNLEMPATTLKTQCYIGMFGECTNVTQAPYLPATQWVSECYKMMFMGCTSISYIKFNLENAQYACPMWLLSANSTGSLVNENPNFDQSTLKSGTDGLPSGWTFYSTDPNA